MEKTTRLNSDDNAPWTLRAMRCVFALTPDRLADPSGCGAVQPSRQSSEPRGRYPLGMHSHAVPELCLSLSGMPFIDIESRRFILRPPAAAILPPLVAHSEGWTHAGHGYEMSWIWSSKVSAQILRVLYRPHKGWIVTDRHTLTSPSAASLLRLLSLPDAARDTACVEMIRADLLVIFGQLHRRLIDAPARTSTRPLSDSHQAVLEQVRNLLDLHLKEQWSLAQLANLTRLTPNYLNRLFHRWTGRNIHQYLIDRRMTEAMRLLREKRWLVKEVARQVGYDDPLYFSRMFHRHHGCWPTQIEP